LTKRHNLEGPQGVRGRNSDNRRLRSALGWEPSILLRQGLALTYPWIEEQLRENGRKVEAVAAPEGSFARSTASLGDDCAIRNAHF
ncbi:MAG TPA: hypothetical protein VEK33_03255, partial [Terriglobales bacterium]|nr:hypothetical protein [Terriglobales bacterium]